jgi:hypothetical protein
MYERRIVACADPTPPPKTTRAAVSAYVNLSGILLAAGLPAADHFRQEL